VRSRIFKEPPPPLRAFGLTAMAILFVVAVTTEPEPGLHGDGPWVVLGLVFYIAGIWMSVPARDVPARRRFIGLVLVTAASVLLTIVQPNGAMVGAVYYVVIIAAIAFDGRTAPVAISSAGRASNAIAAMITT